MRNPSTTDKESGMHSVESRIEVLDFLTSGDSLFRNADVQIICHVANSPRMSHDHESSLSSMFKRHGIFFKLVRNHEES